MNPVKDLATTVWAYLSLSSLTLLQAAPHLTVVVDAGDDVGADSIRVAPKRDCRAMHGRNRGYNAGFSAFWPLPRFSGVLPMLQEEEMKPMGFPVPTTLTQATVRADRWDGGRRGG
jgi:hypothetical protein